MRKSMNRCGNESQVDLDENSPMTRQRFGTAPKVRRAQANPLVAARTMLEGAEKARRARRLDQAQRACETVLKQFPDYVAALYTLGLVHADKGEYRLALPHLVQASMLAPRDWSTLTVLSGVYLKLGSGATALRTLEQARAIKPDDANILATLGEVYREEREYAAAAESFRDALAIAPVLHAARHGLGLCCYELGDMRQAGAAYEALVTDGIISAELIYSLSQLPPEFVRSDLLALAGSLSGEGEADKDDVHSMLSFSKAAALHHLGRHEEAWDEMLEANAPVRERMRDARKTHRQMEQTFLEGVGKFQWPKPDGKKARTSEQTSLFILGPSRCGKTQLERLIGGHPSIKTGDENPIVENSVRQTFQSAALPTRERIFELPPALDQSFREFYYGEFARRAGPARVFTNTHPAHIYSALRLAHVLPDARFVFVKRNLDDMALRIFMKFYQTGNAYAYALEDIREHLEWYYTMAEIVASHIPKRSLMIEYDQMIEDPSGVCNAVLQFCGLKSAQDEHAGLGDDRGCAGPYLDLMKNR